jgi:hypothetical protein
MVALRAAPVAVLIPFAIACAGASAPPPPADAGPDAGPVPCVGTLNGIYELADAGFTCAVALISAPDGGLPASLTLANAGDLPASVVGLGAVVQLPSAPVGGGALSLPPDAGPDAGPPDAGSYAIPSQAQGTATVAMGDGEAFGLDSSKPAGTARVRFTYISDAGVPSGDVLLYTAHGSLDATLPLALGTRPDAGPDGGVDAGPFDAGSVVKFHATF